MHEQQTDYIDGLSMTDPCDMPELLPETRVLLQKRTELEQALGGTSVSQADGTHYFPTTIAGL